PGQRVGVTGANGTGKSSLFALLRGELEPDEGAFHIPRDWVIAHVAQETPAEQRPALDYVLDGDAELRHLESALEAAEQNQQGQRVAELHARLDAVGGYTARARAARLMHGLGFSTADEQRQVAAFSGGWRMRLNLAQALMSRSDLLLLDEPTNHLDLDAVIWLEGWLGRYPGTLLLISHDRDFLDAVVDHIAPIEQGHMTLYRGNYSAFERLRAERLALQRSAWEKQQREIEHMQRFVARFRAKATKARQAQSRLKALERMERIAPAHVDSPFVFRFERPERKPDPLLKLEKAAAGYGDMRVLEGVDLQLSPGDRVGLLGPNGAGKSTLVRLLAGERPPLAGQRETAQELKVGYFAQHQLEQLRLDETPLQHLQALAPRASEQPLRDFLGGFGFQGEQAEAQVAPFSGGEKARLVLALLVYQRPNLLLLDEPTNHLDLEMRFALGRALQGFEGAMVIVSHDRHLLRLVADELLLVVDGGVAPFKGALDDYARWLAEHRNHRGDDAESRGMDRGGSAAGRREQRRRGAERRQRLQPLRKAVRQLEERFEQLGDEHRMLEQRLADPALYEEERKQELKEVIESKGRLDRALAEAEERWLEALEALENAEEEQRV
ncbi:MAG TPA: ATP-binding cassette domain-containing protein, partial [Kiloniellaceae bacterium]|nr:ATP-binding cassette domain-containing protein [Kiloniellaceae bacterium]